MSYYRYVTILLLLPIVPMIISDFKRREVNSLWLILLGMGIIAISLAGTPLYVIFNNILANMGLLLFMGAGVIGYIKLRHNRSATAFMDYIGWGDIIFMVCVTPFFTLYEYSIFLIASFLLSLTWWAVWSLSIGKRLTIPLVGMMGIVFSAHTIYCTI